MQSNNNNFSFKNGGKKLPGIGQNGQANIFAMAASTQQRQDRGYYESLYHFDADVELAEYSLPVRTQQTFGKQKGQSGLNHHRSQQRVASGVINSTHLPPLGGHGGPHPHEIGEDPAEQMMEDIDMEAQDAYGQEVQGMYMDAGMEPDAYGQEMGDDEPHLGDLRNLFKADENKGKDHVADARKANYISKGSFIWKLLNEIETGEQAISFFAKYGQSTPIKFVKCRRKPVPGDQFRPYDLIKVEDDDDNPKSQEGEYFTISAQGVVHVQTVEKKGSGQEQIPCEFMTLSQWMHQSTLFNVLTSMNFFKHYLIGKVFTLWKGNVRFKTYNRTRQALAANLIQTRPAFLKSFMDINKTLYEMKSKLTFQIPTSSKSYDIGEFVTDQKQQREDIKAHYNACVEKIIGESLSDLVKSVTDSRSLKEEEDLEHGGMGKAAKHKSMNLMKQEKKLKERVMSLAERNYASLGTFIRLIDYMVVEAQVSVNQESAELILIEMDKSDGRKYSITANVTFANDNDGMVFEPGQSDFHTQIDKILQDMQAVTEEVGRVIAHTDFHQFIHGLINENGPRFRSIVDQSAAFKATKDKITEHINHDFKVLQDTVNSYKQCREVDEFERTFDFDAWKQENANVVAIRDKLRQLADWDRLVSTTIKTQENSGFIAVQSKRLQQQLVKRVNTEQQNMLDYLLELANQKRHQMNQGLYTIQQELAKIPTELKSYVDFCGMLEQSKIQKDNLIMNKKELDEMKTQLQKYRDREDQSMSLKINSLQSGIETLNVQINEVEAQIAKAAEDVLAEREAHVEDLGKKIVEEQKKVTDLVEQIETSPVLLDKDSKSKEALDVANKIRKRFDDCQRKLSTFKLYQSTLKVQETPMPELAQFEEKFSIRHTIWNIRETFNDSSKAWYNNDFRSQNAEEIISTVTRSNIDLKKLANKIGFDKPDKVLDATLSEVSKVMDHKNLIAALGNQDMKDKHLAEVWKLIPEANFASVSQFSLNQMIEKGIESHVEAVEEISARASGEAAILKTIKVIYDSWAALAFQVDNYRGMKDRYIIGKEVEEIMMQLEDDQMTVGNCMGSKYVVDIRPQVEEWEKRLSTIADVIDEWLAFQKTWMYLENIFNAEDIQTQLPKETKMFQQVDKFWKDHMGRVKKQPIVQETCDSQALLGRFQNYNGVLEEIGTCLQNYLETKRSAFPRFYFLFDGDLLEILSQTRNAQAVQPHLGKCFDNLVKVEFSPQKGSNEILAMISSEGEVVRFSESVYAQGAVEFWLTNIETMMRKTLYDKQKLCLDTYPEDGTKRDAWFFESPAQAVITVDQVKWTSGVTAAIQEIMKGKNKRALEDFLDFSLQQIGAMVKLVQSDLTKLQRIAMGALIVIDVHARSVVEQMIKLRVDNINHFEWTKQLRYYWEKVGPETGDEQDAFARQTNTRFRYSYEYLGNGPRLVITPLTDKCYMTLTGALHLNFGGSPQGPAGTGKTETTKDLAKALAVQCVVFNCSDGLGIQMMATFFSGLAQGGAWACFDEFNRIEIEVLSVIAQQMLTIQSAVRGKKKVFEFEGKEIPLNLRFGVFITMNPGYAGRTELPDNLKALFRPVAMMIPNYGLIAEIILFSEGFATAQDLSFKMVKLYSLSSEQLSKQDHYDFGMRAVKSVLVMAGKLKRDNVDTPEDVVLIRAMRDSNVPKFLEHDLPLFYGIVSDLFPGVDVPNVDYGKLEEAIKNQLRLGNLQAPAKYVGKVIQLLETMIVRHGIMLVGVTGCGKTTCSYILGKALTQLFHDGSTEFMHKPVQIDTLNPKAVRMGELYGETNPLTNDWTEGLVSTLVKNAVAALETDKADWKRWVCFDGPVDAGWIENMNTVLDDNKMLCLPNGQRIKMPATCTMMFEVQDLRIASPATVSRCGMVYLEPVHLGWAPLVETWDELNATVVPDEYRKQITAAIINIFTTALPFIRKKCREVIGSVDANLVASCLRLLDSFLAKLDLNKKDAVPFPQKAVMTYLTFSIVWSLGANLHDQSRKAFNDHIKPHLKKLFNEYPDGDVYDYGIDGELHRYERWIDRVEEFQFDRDQSFFEILVPTSDTAKYKFLLTYLLGHGMNVLITGETGVGKSVVTKDFLGKAPADMVSACVNFSGKTTTGNLVDAFEANLEPKRKTLLGPPSGKKMVFFIDDVNMPQYDRYDAQPPVELLRQTIDQHGFYDIKKLIFKKIQDTSFVCACGPPSGGRNPVTPRLFRHFNMVWVPDLSEASMRTIFTQILSGFLKLNDQNPLDMFAENIIKASVDLYQKTMAEFLPTPSKSHYTFNLRDLSKVVQGMLMIEHVNLEDKDTLVRLWIHETFRVFRDRLVDQDDRDRYAEMAHEKLVSYLDMEWELKDYTNVLFGDYENGNRHYMQLNAAEMLIPRLDAALDMHNAENSPMNLVFFEDCIQHLTRICRVLRQDRGNVLLVGVGGSGRRSMARLGAHMNEQKTFQIEITKSYREKEYHEDLRNLLRIAGADNEKIVFLFSDTQIVRESFLEDINNLVNSGEVPKLFPNEDKTAICEEVAPRARAAGQGDSRDALFSYFVQICRENLHIILAFSPVGDLFRNRCRQFPSITNCCTIDWYNPWPADALYAVAHRSLQADEAELGITEHIDELCKLCVEIHRSVADASDAYWDQLRRKNYTTPTSYLDLIKTYKDMLKERRNVVPREIEKYKSGLQRLADTNEQVAGLQKELVVLLPEIDESKAETAKLVESLQVEQKGAAEKEKVVQAEAAEANKIKEGVLSQKTECQGALDEAMPIYHKALGALKTLKKDDIDEIKKYSQVGKEIEQVFCAVCLLFKEKENFEAARKLMADPKGFIDRLQKYDADKNITEAMHKKLKKYTQDPGLTPEILKTKSAACESICKFIRAMDNYVDVMKIIKPKQAALQEAEAELKVAEEKLAVKQASLKKVKDYVAGLERTYQEKQQYLESLNTKKENTELQLVRADKLVNGLAAESLRWKEREAELGVELLNLVGDVMIAAGYSSYVGPFTANFRKDLIEKWMKFAGSEKIPFSPSFTIRGALGDPILEREWNIQGLPADSLSIENGIICNSAKRWPLLIDPQSQANKWIKNMEKDNQLKVTKLADPKFLNIIEGGCKAGLPALLENIDETLDPSLGPLMERNIVKDKGGWVIKLSDGLVPWNPEFNFYITTKMANPHYLPEICIKVTLINFTVTPEGLEDQLLVDVVKYEQPELEQQRDQLVVQLSDFNKQLSDLEAKILKLVAEAGADILEDEELIVTLEQSKQTSTTINAKVAEAEKTSIIINENRENYRGVARRGSVLYFVIADLGLIDPMYQYSLEFFAKLFNRRLDKSTKSKVLEERLQILLDDITEAYYVNICRGLFEKDKLLYAYLNATAIQKKCDAITQKEFGIYLRGSMTDFSGVENTCDFIPDETFRKVLGLEEAHENFENLSKSFSNPSDAAIWREIMLSETPNAINMPADIESKLTPFQKLMIINVLRQEKLVNAIKKYVGSILGEPFTKSPPFDLVGVLADSVPVSPIIFVLSPGADPIADLMALAKTKGMESRLKALSLGQGQGPKASKLISDGHLTGDWVCLQNCHLSASWMPELEKIQEAQDEGTMHPEYRLWLTSEPSKDFPVPVLQAGIKLTNEPPRGLKANLARTYQDVSEEDYESCTKPKEYKKLLFALAYFHAAILERRKYGPIGWNIEYMWMTSDLETSKRQLKMYLEEQDLVPYQALNYLVAEANYGGRVTDDKDVRLITAMLRRYLCPEIMNDSYKLAKANEYYAPPEGPLADTLAYIEQLPPDEDPEVFGLHPNANIAYETRTVGVITDTVLALQPRVAAAGGGKTPDEIAQDLARDILARLPPQIDREKSHPSVLEVTPSGQPKSLNVFLGQELDRFNALTAAMRKQLSDLDKAIAGTVVMSLELEVMMGKFLDNKVPPKWEAPLGYPSLKPLGSWVNDLVERLQFMAKWCYEGAPDTYWLSAFFFPQGFMTAALQTYARKTATPIDALIFKTNVRPYGPDAVAEVPEDGVNVHGLFLQGARWDTGRAVVEDSDPRVPIVVFPCIWLEPVASTENVRAGCYECPLYKTSARKGELSTTGHSTNFVLYMHLPSEMPEDYWVRRGVALLCMTDD